MIMMNKTRSAIALILMLVLALTVLPFMAGAKTIADTTTLVTVGSGNGGNNNSSGPSISADGSMIAFASRATDLAGAPANGNHNIFVYDTSNGSTTLVTAGSGLGGDSNSYEPSISADGSMIAFASRATDLAGVPANGDSNIFLYDTFDGSTTLVTVGSGSGGNDNSYEPSISADGSVIAFSSGATNLAGTPTGGDNNIFLYDTSDGSTMLVTVGSGNGGNNGSFTPSISADGSMITFGSYATNLVGAPANGNGNIFLYDASDGSTTLVTVGSGSGGNNNSSGPSISADGSMITFGSHATNLSGTSANGNHNIFLYDTSNGSTTLVTAASGLGGDSNSHDPSMSADGSMIAFASRATNLVGALANGDSNIFLWTRTVTLDVTFDPQNGIDQPFTETVLQGQAISAPDTPAAPAGMVFAGWWTAAEGGTQWNFGSPVDEDMELFAHWAVIPVTDMIEIFYGATEGGSVTVKEETIPATGTPGGSTAIADAGFTFIGWIGTTFASEDELDAWLDWLESLEDPMDAIISTETHLIPPANADGVWSDADYIAIFIPSDEVPPVTPTIPSTGDSTTLWPIALAALLGCAVMSAAVYRKKFEQ